MDVEGLLVEEHGVRTNMAFFTLEADWITPPQLLEALGAEGVKVSHYGKGVFRTVTHHGIEEEDIHVALEVIGRVIKEMS